MQLHNIIVLELHKDNFILYPNYIKVLNEAGLKSIMLITTVEIIREKQRLYKSYAVHRRCYFRSAGLVWLKNNEDKAIRLLDSFWMENSANSLHDIFLNEWLVNIYRFPGGIAMLQPYLHPGKSDWAQSHLRGMLEKHVDFKEIKKLLTSSSPILLIGAIDINSGYFKNFKNDEINAEVMPASVALPILYRAVHICVWCDRKLVFSWRGNWDKRYEGGWDVDDFDDSAEKGEDDLGNLVASCIPCIAIKGNVE